MSTTPNAHLSATRGPTFIPELTGLRALAAAVVMVAHAIFWCGKVHENLLGRYYSRLEFSVPIFFSLSGFVLFHSWITWSQRLPPGKHLLSYIKHRCERIVPAYYCTLALAMLCAPWFISNSFPFHPQPAKSYVLYLWFGQIFHPLAQLHGLTHTWSLAVEWYWYMVFPLVAVSVLWVAKRKPHYAHLVALAYVGVGLGIFSLQVYCSRNIMVNNYLFYPWGFLSWFCIGVWVAVISHDACRKYLWVALCVVIGGLAWSGSGFFGTVTMIDYNLNQAWKKYVLYTCISGAVFIIIKAGKASFLAAKPLVWLGEISYETFLLHVPVMEVWMKFLHWPVFQGNPLLLVLEVYLITVPLAFLLHLLCNKALATSKQLAGRL